MTTLAEVTAKSIGKAASSVVKPISLGRGTLVTRNLAVTRRFLEDLLGMDCIATAPGRMLARHGRDRGAKGYWVLEVSEAVTIEHPQRLINIGVSWSRATRRSTAPTLSPRRERGLWAEARASAQRQSRLL